MVARATNERLTNTGRSFDKRQSKNNISNIHDSRIGSETPIGMAIMPIKNGFASRAMPWLIS